MKKISLIIASVMVAIAFAMPASAQLRIGPKVGICVNELHFNKSLGSSDNRTGFTGGVMLDGRIPLLGFAFDASLMYVRRDAGKEVHNDYIAIPVNLKYRFGFPVISRIVVPFLTTGPEWAYMVDHSKIELGKENKSNFSWNFGLGVELLSHVQVAASYGLGLSKTYESGEVNGKNRFWTVTAAYLF
ncbi:porin family protein [uncultured Muribaculum sp.]|uniref:porin family protein n=1 Tax=uncultured Muribaculum sp. TaxID=1918613 RepID=UPI00260016E7|nr:porin family protein [uncultured Muribaculum sp.]